MNIESTIIGSGVAGSVVGPSVGGGGSTPAIALAAAPAIALGEGSLYEAAVGDSRGVVVLGAARTTGSNDNVFDAITYDSVVGGLFGFHRNNGNTFAEAIAWFVESQIPALESALNATFALGDPTLGPDFSVMTLDNVHQTSPLVDSVVAPSQNANPQTLDFNVEAGGISLIAACSSVWPIVSGLGAYTQIYEEQTASSFQRSFWYRLIGVSGVESLEVGYDVSATNTRSVVAVSLRKA